MTQSSADTIVVAEDDEDLLQTYELWLSAHEDADVVTALDGETAREAVSDGTDVLVLDRDLPELPGPELLESLSTDDLSVVVVSAYEPDGHLGRDDVSEYLVKPIRRNTFVGTIDSIRS